MTQVDVFDAEPPGAVFSPPQPVPGKGIQLGGDEHLLAQDAALA
jgi:hypothetical protein